MPQGARARSCSALPRAYTVRSGTWSDVTLIKPGIIRAPRWHERRGPREYSAHQLIGPLVNGGMPPFLHGERKGGILIRVLVPLRS